MNPFSGNQGKSVKVLIFGGWGMLGHKLWQTLAPDSIPQRPLARGWQVFMKGSVLVRVHAAAW